MIDCSRTFNGNLEVSTLENEVKMWKLISAVVDSTLKKYQTSLEEDQKLLLDGNDLTFNIRNCILYRITEKECLYFLKDIADKIFLFSVMTAKEANNEMKNWKEPQSKYGVNVGVGVTGSYFFKILLPLLP